MSHSAAIDPLGRHSFFSGQSRSWRHVSVSVSRPSGITENSYSTLVNATIRDLDRVAKLEQNWDGFNSQPPSPCAIKRASDWILSMETSVGAKSASKPHVSASEAGEVTFEWWNNDRKLTLYFSDCLIEYMKVGGPNIHTDMESGRLDKQRFPDLWEWLIHG